MNVATALNRKYILYTGVMLTSLCENNPCHIDVYILHSELTDKDIQRLKDCLDKYDVTIYLLYICLLYTSPSPRDISGSRMPSSA